MQMRLEGVRGVMLDFEGTVYTDQALIPGPWRRSRPFARPAWVSDSPRTRRDFLAGPWSSGFGAWGCMQLGTR